MNIHELAGEYVLGTLSAAQRQAVEVRLATDADLQAAVLAWEERLLPLASLTEPVAPSPRLWKRIARSIDALAVPAPWVTRPKPKPWWRDWHSLSLWRGLTAGGFASAAILAAVLVERVMDPPPPATRFMVVLVAPDDKAPGWVVQASASRQIELIPLGVMEVPADKALQFWTKAEGWSGPVSLGLVTPGQSMKVPVDTLPAVKPNQLFELTLEPRTGSPTGKPTGPIRYIGRAVQVM
jgi:anti-sigma-K factor RskA